MYKFRYRFQKHVDVETVRGLDAYDTRTNKFSAGSLTKN